MKGVDVIVENKKGEQDFIESIYKELYPELFHPAGFVKPLAGHTLNEIQVRPVGSSVNNLFEVDLSCQIGPVKLNTALMSAAMDTVTGPEMAGAMSEIGGVGIITRHKKANVQLDWIEKALRHKHCLVSEPKTVTPDNTLEDVRDILSQFDFSTIPVVTEDNVLEGMVFTDTIAFKGHFHEPVSQRMTPFKKLKYETTKSHFCKIKNRLLEEKECNVLPIIDDDRRLRGMYFMKDFLHINPSTHNGKPLVGMAVGVEEDDLSRVMEALDLGVGMIVIDSSHGNCDKVISQTKRVVVAAKDKAAVVAGNIADIDGYYRLAESGVDAVKCGIGSGSICTTSQVTGAGFPLFTLLRELSYTRSAMAKQGMPTPAIISDGGINGPGDMVISQAAGSDACMAGKWMVAAEESKAYVEGKTANGYVLYRGMASKAAIDERITDHRYGKQKRAPEGEEIRVKVRGSLKHWFGNDKELIQGGYSHCGAHNLEALREYGKKPYNFPLFTQAGQLQNQVRE